MSARPDLASGRWIMATRRAFTGQERGEWIGAGGTEYTGAELARALWDAGLSASRIAERVGHGCTKSAVVGYAHRNRWPPRPSPIAVNGQRPAVATPRKPKPARKPKVAAKAPPKPKAPPAPPAPPQRAPEPVASHGCQWIYGDGRPWTMCGKQRAPGSPYCAEHHARAYNRPPRMGLAA